ncbi:hypothetical protein Tco_0996874 [Tanacetum coccineum]
MQKKALKHETELIQLMRAILSGLRSWLSKLVENIESRIHFHLLSVSSLRIPQNREAINRVVYSKSRKKKDKSIVAFHLIRTPSFPAITAHHVDSQVLYANQYINEDVHSHVHNVSALCWKSDFIRIR